MSDLRKAAEMALEFVVLSSSKDRAWFTEKEFEVVAALRQALAQPEQKPVAWLEPEWQEKICPEVGYEVTITDDHPRDLCWIPLYTAPPKREWVGLTDEEIDKTMVEYPIDYKHEFAKAIEAKLKEKNGG